MAAKAADKASSGKRTAASVAAAKAADRASSGRRTPALSQSEGRRKRPGTKEDRLKRLGKWTGNKEEGGKNPKLAGKSKSPRKGTPTFKRQKK